MHPLAVQLIWALKKVFFLGKLFSVTERNLCNCIMAEQIVKEMLFKLETFTTFLFRSISGFKEKKILYPI
jgi:hypothetical protein